ncbi:tyrosine-type recombinase/integrase [Streptomyces sp. NBC_00654]|uniref:tyrosine-type recombinase/integrase n=1 Tax=Streptomyces sp. NBC_00654 TaxID=2975799 RepID=UPI00225871EA|nr:tyrosine-type recombinase/integrase [Streptomyces sp. NBC_00654]MCX4969351.1 tyrosine-type recombinase/integrase [Streptomyces sp. NBC_00654]MCX4971130.1 tyrosine-type recombinase/integrase [Streptomyces sp. NBC_00654]
MAASWLRALKSENKSDNTIRIYANAVNSFARFLLDQDAGYRPVADEEGTPGRPAPSELDEVHREHVQAYIAATIARTSPANAHQHFRALKTFFNWLTDEEEIDRTPMRTMKPPTVTENEVPVIPEADLVKLFRACKGKTYADRRDTAILLLFLDTGVRLSELTDRKVVDLDLDLMVLRVLGKKDKWRSVPFGRTAATALDRYLRAAAKHKGKALEEDMWLWWGDRGQKMHRFTIWGVGTMLKRRCAEAEIDPIHPHQFRHTFAHLWKVNGGNEDDLMRITGWSSRQMLSRYASSAGAERARSAHARLSPADRLG